MNGHPQFDEDFDLYEVGALDPDEKSAMESHIESCPACASKLAAARERVALLALAAAPAEPPERVKQRLMLRVKQDSSHFAKRQPANAQPTQRDATLVSFWHQSLPAWSLAAAAAIVAAILGVNNYRLRGEIRDRVAQEQSQQQAQQAQESSLARSRAVLDLLTAADTQKVTLTSTPSKPQPEGKVYYHPNRGLLFYVSNLPATPANRTYQLWLVPAQGSPISAGIFEPDQNGNASIVLPRLPEGVAAKAFAVTVEPAGGVPQPTGPKVLIGAS